MNCFVVIAPEHAKLHSAVQENFPEHHYEISPGVWAVAARNKVPSDICETLNIGDGGVAGVVFSLSEYNGYFQSSLWEKINLWEKL